MITPAPPLAAVTAMMRREIDRFITAARERSEFDIDTRRRAMRRYHRSWPLLVCTPDSSREISAALHSASAGGIGFVCERAFPVGGLVLVKLFWYEDRSLRVPALVRHATPYCHGILNGCEFTIEDQEACEVSLRFRRQWRG